MLKTAQNTSADNVDQLVRFTEYARDRGMEYGTNRHLLLSVGWKDAARRRDDDTRVFEVHHLVRRGRRRVCIFVDGDEKVVDESEISRSSWPQRAVPIAVATLFGGAVL